MGKAENIRHISCPSYPGLSIEALFDFAKKHPITEKYWPDPRDRHKLPRSYVANVIYTLVGDAFADYVAKKIEERNKKLAME